MKTLKEDGNQWESQFSRDATLTANRIVLRELRLLAILG